MALAGRGSRELAVTPEVLAKCDVPIRFVRGENESAHVKTKIDEARKRLGRGDLVIVPGRDQQTTPVKPEFGKTLRESSSRNVATVSRSDRQRGPRPCPTGKVRLKVSVRRNRPEAAAWR